MATRRYEGEILPRSIKRNSLEVRLGNGRQQIIQRDQIPTDLLTDPEYGLVHNFVPGDVLEIHVTNDDFNNVQITNAKVQKRIDDVYAVYICSEAIKNQPHHGTRFAKCFTLQTQPMALLHSHTFNTQIDCISEFTLTNQRRRTIFEGLPPGSIIRCQMVNVEGFNPSDTHHIQKITKVYDDETINNLLSPPIGLPEEEIKRMNQEMANIYALLYAFDNHTSTEYHPEEEEEVPYRIVSPPKKLPVRIQFDPERNGFVKENSAIAFSVNNFKGKGILYRDPTSGYLETELAYDTSLNFLMHGPSRRLSHLTKMRVTPATSESKKKLVKSLKEFTMYKIPQYMESTNNYVEKIYRLLLKREYHNPPVDYLHPRYFAKPHLPNIFGQEHEIFFSAVLDRKVPLSNLIGPPGMGKSSVGTITAANIVEKEPKAKILLTGPSNESVNVQQRRFSKWNDENRSDFKQVRITPRYLDPEKYKGCHDLLPSVFSGFPAPNEPYGLTKTRNDLAELEAKLYRAEIPPVGFPKRQETLEKMYKDVKLCEKLRKRLEYWATEYRDPQIYGATLNATANELFEWKSFDYIIVDEVGQATLPEFLFACRLLKPGGQVITLGDPKQLGPLVLARGAGAKFLKKSPAIIMEKNQTVPVTRLVRSFRCIDPLIRFNSVAFYREDLFSRILPEERDILTSKTTLPSDIPLLWLEIYGQEMCDSSGLFNPREIEAVRQITEYLQAKDIRYEDVQIITPYRGQDRKFKELLHPKIEVNTIDSFQGGEAPIIILSIVRSPTTGAHNYANIHYKRILKSKSIGFLSDENRINVATSRQRDALIIVGNPDYICTEKETWGKLFQYIENHRGNHQTIEDLFGEAPKGPVLSDHLPEDPPKAKWRSIPET